MKNNKYTNKRERKKKSKSFSFSIKNRTAHYRQRHRVCCVHIPFNLPANLNQFKCITFSRCNQFEYFFFFCCTSVRANTNNVCIIRCHHMAVVYMAWATSHMDRYRCQLFIVVPMLCVCTLACVRLFSRSLARSHTKQTAIVPAQYVRCVLVYDPLGVI